MNQFLKNLPKDQKLGLVLLGLAVLVLGADIAAGLARAKARKAEPRIHVPSH